MPAPTIRDFSPFEERFHALSHSLAAIVAVIGFFLLLTKASQRGSLPAMIAVSIYGVSMVSVFLTSAIYHMSGDSPRRGLFKLLDHIASNSRRPESVSTLAFSAMRPVRPLWTSITRTISSRRVSTTATAEGRAPSRSVSRR
ncbi:MAG: hemolysin III family protein [Proteobacteria bacterium]|nr:hemolysin III family protein [Pseudomonadota bacterium]